ncbi:hypothetical protein AVO42_11070 [Thiomicrospira sp. XS5]|uniref:50S ribosome-binding protein YggL n=1 Tax=Thiomicrospira sp. XS5 TaxID=1775636 RepID=UPI0007466A38|nr:50S ribosome-binding protein YggL [Thiomicrospira sp. XS5]KUJ75813.1 hypothetical protein AVO42_11070 [Thiomicrospira sp. XS5]
MATRSRRLRKKLYLDEFSVYGFEVKAQCSLKNGQSYDEFIDSFLDFIERRGLLFGGGGELDRFDGFIASQQRYGSPDEDDRQAVKEWLERHCTDCEISDLVNAYYG